jgi:hypothetical protein
MSRDTARYRITIERMSPEAQRNWGPDYHYMAGFWQQYGSSQGHGGGWRTKEEVREMFQKMRKLWEGEDDILGRQGDRLTPRNTDFHSDFPDITSLDSFMSDSAHRAEQPHLRPKSSQFDPQCPPHPLYCAPLLFDQRVQQSDQQRLQAPQVVLIRPPAAIGMIAMLTPEQPLRLKPLHQAPERAPRNRPLYILPATQAWCIPPDRSIEAGHGYLLRRYLPHHEPARGERATIYRPQAE